MGRAWRICTSTLPWTDLNQTYWEISRYMEKYPNTPCWVDSNWFVPASKYNVPCTQMGDHWEAELPLHMKGIVFVSGSWLYVYGHEGEPLFFFFPRSRAHSPTWGQRDARLSWRI